MNIVVHHNPDCGTSRNVLAILEAAGYRPTVIEYLKTGWTRPQLLGLFAAAGLTPKDALRVLDDGSIYLTNNAAERALRWSEELDVCRFRRRR